MQVLCAKQDHSGQTYPNAYFYIEKQHSGIKKNIRHSVFRTLCRVQGSAKDMSAVVKPICS